MYKKLFSNTNELTPNQAAMTISGVGIGATDEFSLRVSTGVLAQLYYVDEQGNRQAVLERKATCETDKNNAGQWKAKLQAQPVGGASRLLKPQVLLSELNGFNYDSADSATGGDFRIQVRPEDWSKVKAFCLNSFTNLDIGNVEANVEREVCEELLDAFNVSYTEGDSLSTLQKILMDMLGAKAITDVYQVENLGPQLQGEPQVTEKMGVSGSVTARVFNIQRVVLISPALIAQIRRNADIPNDQLASRAREKALKAGKGKATALAIIPEIVLADKFPTGQKESAVDYNGLKISDTVGITWRTKP